MPWMRYIPEKRDPNKKKTNFSRDACVKVAGGTTGDCLNTPVKIHAVRTGAIVKVPVVLAELTLQLDIDATVDLPVVVSEIIDIKNNIKIHKCQLIPRTNKLFIKGGLSQSIEYKVTRSIYDGKFESLNQCKVDIPFGCTTSIYYNGGEPLDPVPNDTETFEYNNQSIYGIGCKTNEVLESLEQNRISTENFNDLPYCELTSSKVVEYDRYLNCGNNTSKGKSIKGIEENIVIYLTIKILQSQQIEVSPMALKAVCEKDS